MTAIDRLDQIEARANAATEGPWLPEYGAEQGTCVIPADAESTREAVCVTRLCRRGPDSAFIAAARTDVPALVAALRAVLDRHEPETRWQSDPDSEWSYDTPEDAAAYEEMDPAECTSFVICRECGRVEKADAERQVHGEFSGYAESLYPCPTVRAIEEAL